MVGSYGCAGKLGKVWDAMLKLKLYEMDPEKSPQGYWDDRERMILEITVDDYTDRGRLLESLAIILGEKITYVNSGK